MGGLAMYGGMLAGLGLSRVLPFFSDMNRGYQDPLDALVVCTLIVILGMVDDRRGIMALTKFTGQVFVIGVLLLLGGVQLRYVWLPGHSPTGNIVNLAQDPSVLLTFIWTLAVVNAVNLLATVRDKHGNIIRNLTKDDFVLDQDGKPQTITGGPDAGGQ